VRNILLNLVDSNKIPTAKLLVDTDQELRRFLITSLSTNDNSKHAAALVKEFGLNIDDFPEVKERLMKSSMRYYLGRFLYKKPG
jgi:hypothetical protein